MPRDLIRSIVRNAAASRSLAVARSVARRACLARGVSTLAPALAVAGVVALALAIADKALAERLSRLAPRAVWLAAPFTIAALGALVHAIATAPTLIAAAARADASLGLKDRLSSALELGSSNDPFAAWTIAQAEQLAAQADPRRVVPVRLRWAHAIAPALACIAIAVTIWMPARIPSTTQPDPATLAAARTSTAQQIKSAATALASQAPAATATPARPEELRALEDLQSELAESRLSPEDARLAAAQRVEQAASRMDTEARERQTSLDRAREALSAAARSADQGSASNPSGTDADAPSLTEALREGDLARAADALRSIDRQRNDMLPEQREAIAQQLEELARRIENTESARNDRESPTQPPNKFDASPATNTNADKPESGSQERDPARAPEAAQPKDSPADTPKPESPKPPPPSKQSPLDRLRDAMREAARQMRPDAPNEAKPRDQSGPAQKQREPSTPSSPTNSSSKPTSDPKDGSPRPPPNEPTRNPQENSDQPSEPKAPSERPAPSDQPSRPSPSSPSGQSPGNTAPDAAPPKNATPKDSPTNPADGPAPTTPSQDPSAPKGDAQQSQAPRPSPSGTSPQGQNPAPSDNPTPDATPQRSPSPTQRDKPAPQPGEQPSPQGSDQPDPSALRRAERELRDLADQPKDAQEQQRRAQRLRDLAHELQKQMTPEQQQEVQRLAQQIAQEAQQRRDGAAPDQKRTGPGEQRPPTPTPGVQSGAEGADHSNPAGKPSPDGSAHGINPDMSGVQNGSGSLGPGVPPRSGPAASEPQASDRTLDARRAPEGRPRERVIAEWYSNRPPATGEHAARATPAEEVRRAADAADRAIEQQTVPARYSDLVRRVFKRYAEQVATPPPASEVRPAPR